jgi:hypothetical protein
MTDTTDKEPQPITHRGRRISWAELYRQRPDLRPANDDGKQEGKEAA